MAATGLDFCQDLPSPRLPAIKIPAPASAPATATATQPPLDNKEVQECRTPTSKEHKIPTILTCPPAPRKPARRVAASCKRKLQFFEITNREEVEDLFRTSFSMINSSRAKRSCPCT